jgi:hypothetical protein
MESSKTVKFSGGQASFHCRFTKKSQLVSVALVFETKEKLVLYHLLNKFIAEKVLDCGLNVQNQISGAWCTSNGIFFTVPDNKVMNSIIQCYKYLMTKSLAAPQTKLIPKGSYNKLHSDIKNFDVYVVGKARNTLKALKENTAKITMFTKAMGAIDAVKFDDFETNVKGDAYPHTMKGDLKGLDAKAKLQFAICYAGIPFEIDGQQVKLLDVNAELAMAQRALMKNTFSARVKAFHAQFGIPGSAGDAKTREKNSLIVDSVNIASDMLGALYGVSYKFKDAKDVKSVDTEALGLVKKVKVA